ncbi:hypothetical protein GW17_00052756 [Ensete ventricosum]|nr:hypothetical protein GW17_00052756 [Ensete ventricosum]RZS20311.1 hypothetical protein BHM03_00052807 [Ensete ventricosum]
MIENCWCCLRIPTTALFQREEQVGAVAQSGPVALMKSSMDWESSSCYCDDTCQGRKGYDRGVSRHCAAHGVAFGRRARPDSVSIKPAEIGPRQPHSPLLMMKMRWAGSRMFLHVSFPPFPSRRGPRRSIYVGRRSRH